MERNIGLIIKWLTEWKAKHQWCILCMFISSPPLLKIIDAHYIFITMSEQQQQYLPTQVPRFELNIND